MNDQNDRKGRIEKLMSAATGLSVEAIGEMRDRMQLEGASAMDFVTEIRRLAIAHLGENGIPQFLREEVLNDAEIMGRAIARSLNVNARGGAS